MEYSVPGARPDTTKSGRTERVRLRTSPPLPPPPRTALPAASLPPLPSLTSRRKDWGRPPSKPGWHVTRRPSMDPFEMRQSCGGDGGTANKENRFEYGEGNLLSKWLRSDLCLDKPAVLRPPMRCNPKQLMQRDILPLKSLLQPCAYFTNGTHSGPGALRTYRGEREAQTE